MKLGGALDRDMAREKHAVEGLGDLRPVLGELAALRSRAEALVVSRSNALGAKGSVRERLVQLLEEPVLFVERPMRIGNLIVAGALLATSVLFTVTARNPLAMLPWGVPAAFVIALTLSSRAVFLVTQRRLVVGAVSAPLSELQSVHFKRRNQRTLWPVRVTLRMRDGRVLEVNVQRVPAGIEAVLRDRGVDVERRDGLFDVFN